MADLNSFEEGQRIICDGHYGTVKFVGEVPPSSGLWYGIEWDEDDRGKHNGVHEGVKYFECSRLSSGSFVRERKLDFGVSDVEALLKKMDDLHDEEEREGMKFFYHVGRNDKQDVNENLRQLKHVVLRWTNVSRGGKENTLSSVAPNIVELDLSKTLVSDWQEVLKIISNLSRLSKLDLSENRLKIVGKYQKTNMVSLKTLVVNKMNLNWQQTLSLAATFPALEELHASYNNISSLQGGDLEAVKKLKKIDLKGNNLSTWNDILSLQVLPDLESLTLSDTKLDNICFPGNNDQSVKIFIKLKSLFLSKTMISNWSSIIQLNRLTALEVLSLQKCPLVEGVSDYDIRCEIIARLAKCSQLNNSNVTAKERLISERVYLKKYGKEWLVSGGNPDNIHSKVDDEFEMKHPRYLPLLAIHGAPECVGLLPSTSSSLKDNLVAVTITCVTDIEKKSVTKKLPCSMTISKLKGLLQRLFKVQTTKQKLSYVDRTGHEVEMDDELRPLSFYSLESGGTINLKW